MKLVTYASTNCPRPPAETDRPLRQPKKASRATAPLRSFHFSDASLPSKSPPHHLAPLILPSEKSFEQFHYPCRTLHAPTINHYTQMRESTTKKHLRSTLGLCLLTVGWIARPHAQNQAQLIGKAAKTYAMVSASNRVFVADLSKSDDKTPSGHVRVHEWADGAWVRLGTDIKGGEAKRHFGWSMAVNGNRLAIGAPHDGSDGANSGYVRVYEWTGSAWIQLGADIKGGEAKGHFGWSVAIHGDLLAVGVPHDSGAGANSGYVRTYHWTGDEWIQLNADIDSEKAGGSTG